MQSLNTHLFLGASLRFTGQRCAPLHLHINTLYMKHLERQKNMVIQWTDITFQGWVLFLFVGLGVLPYIFGPVTESSTKLSRACVRYTL